MFITMMMLGRCQLCRCAHRHICRSRAGTDVACALLARAGTREGRARRGVFAAAESLAISAHAAENTVVAVVAVVAAALGNRSSVTVPGEQVGARKRAAVGCGDREVIAARAVKVGALRGDAPHRRCTTHAVAAALLLHQITPDRLGDRVNPHVAATSCRRRRKSTLLAAPQVQPEIALDLAQPDASASVGSLCMNERDL